MAVAPISSIKIFSNDGSELLDSADASLFGITAKGSTLNVLSNGSMVVGSEETFTYTYSGSNKFLGLSNSANSSVPDFPIGYSDTLINTGNGGVDFGDYYFYIVEEKPESPKGIANKLQNILNAANAATGKNDTNLTDGVRSLIANAQKPQLNAPTISVNGDTLTISNPSTNGNFASNFIVFVDGVKKIELAETTINLKDYFTEEGTYNLAVKCVGMYFNDSGLSNTVIYKYSKFTPPPKGSLITLNLDGKNRTYRVIKINDTVAEIMAMFEVNTSIQFNSSGANTYAGGTLDNYINNTWYGTLTPTAKAAIVDKTFQQDSWYRSGAGNPDYSGYYGTSNPGTSSYTVSLRSATYGISITRHVYALSVQDVIDYVTDTSITDGKLQNYNIWKMFYNETSQPSSYYYHWLRSANAEYSNYAFTVGGELGYLCDDYFTTGHSCRPALQIDLSKIAFTVQ